MSDLACETCGNEAPFWIFPDCLKCSGAHIVHNPGPWNSNRPYYVGAPELAVLDHEIARQREALACVPNLRVRQAG